MKRSLWRHGRLSLSLLALTALAVSACTGGGGSSPSAAASTPTAAASEPAMSEAPTSQAPASQAAESAAPVAGGLLEKVLDAGSITMSTDPEYPPQSSLKADGTYEGFDIDVGTEIATRLGVDITFETPGWDAITAGNWNEPLGLQRRIDDDHDRPREGHRLHRALLLHPGTAGRAGRLDDRVGRRTSRARRSASGSSTTYQSGSRARSTSGRRRRMRPPKGSRSSRSRPTATAPRAGSRAGATSTAG